MPKIQPTIGRRIWFWPSHADRTLMVQLDPEQPLDAGVLYVHPDDGSVNLQVTDHHGGIWFKPAIFILDADAPRSGGFAQWMPYQAKQADAADTIEGRFQLAQIGLMEAQAENLREQTKKSRYDRNANTETGAPL